MYKWSIYAVVQYRVSTGFYGDVYMADRRLWGCIDGREEDVMIHRVSTAGYVDIYIWQTGGCADVYMEDRML